MTNPTMPKSGNKYRLGKTAQLATLVGCAALLAGCGSMRESAGLDGGKNGEQSISPSSEQFNARAAQLEFEQNLQTLASEVAAHYGGRVSLAVVGRDAEFTGGEEGREQAWSTIKVPIAVAAAQQGASEELIDATIKESDNNAAYMLWLEVEQAKGSAETTVAELLGEVGSSADITPAFGESVWPVLDQARFGAALSCIDGAEPIYQAMDDVVDWQSWGLSNEKNVRAKGGWGFDEDTGQYTARQLGVLKLPRGDVGLAVSVSWIAEDWADIVSKVDSGEHQSIEELSTYVLDELAGKLVAEVNKAYAAGVVEPVKTCLR
ncbi:MAG: hypothetical protein SOW59_04415 [Corynebacterium sp.]|nr:hypothetical protein [Corynebacterium sp.]